MIMTNSALRSCSWAVFAVLLAVSGTSPSSDPIAAVTIPSADVTLSFIQPGQIREVFVNQGDHVQVGQLLVQQDDALEQAQLAQIEALSKNTTQIRASEASLAQKKVDLKKLEKAAAGNAATELELEHAKLDVTMAELSLELTNFEHEQNGRKYEEAKIRIENMRLESPISGKVEKVQVEGGEAANALGEVARIVRTDPLWIDVPVPLDVAGPLKAGQAATVEFPGPKPVRIEGKVIWVAKVADAASSTLLVRVEVANTAKRPAGEHVKVSF